MDDIYISEFLDLSKTCSFQTTSINMNVSVSSLSKHLAKLEDELGVPLFDRSTRTVILNEYGKIFLDYALKSIELKQQCLATLHTRSLKESAQLNIGCMPIVEYYGIPNFVYEFVRYHPDINLRINEKHYMADFFKDDPCDFVFADIPHLNGINISNITVITDHMVAVLPKDHPLAYHTSIDLADLKDEHFILNGQTTNSLSRSAIEFYEKAQLAGFTPNIALVCSNYIAIIDLVSKGYGITIINRGLIARQFREKVAVVELNMRFDFNIYCLFREDGQHSPYFDMFLKFIKSKSPIPQDNFLLEFGGN